MAAVEAGDGIRDVDHLEPEVDAAKRSGPAGISQ
jgi:hypothetical protein